ncbi:FecCD family ABC transporter permease [Alicycliphilus denitrificans]|uniref:Iron ABC transporter permease n=1 Tax=Alicycliphilus denitrificans TaxID=179636 RepID=A0A3R7HNI1_9BURK|nr:iron ABC transporter permease [Alicycliphilus denitrificans]RKJ96412.1 iron ABC transporter permease [Alicycliphilus denitrificans]HRO79886.1 iron ABC transporter permease [Alicycliphilus denitrificans]
MSAVMPPAALAAAPAAGQRRALWLALWLLLASCALLVLGASVGSTGFDSVLHAGRDPLARQIVWDIRLPRTLGAWLAGALLGLAGAVAQGLFRNPLADPYLLGSASGAALGGAVAMAMLGVSPTTASWLAGLGVTSAAFIGAAGAVLLTLVLARGVQHTLRLLLAGVIVGVVLSAARDLIQVAKPQILESMQVFTMGSSAFVGWQACALMAGSWALCAAAAWALSRLLDGLMLGEATAASLGLPLAPMRAGLVLAMALATGTAVAHTGLIAFVGLAAPHLVRSIARVTHQWHVWLSSLMGAVLLLAADILARWLIAPQELPVGVLTAALGGSYLLWLMHRRTLAVSL